MSFIPSYAPMPERAPSRSSRSITSYPGDGAPALNRLKRASTFQGSFACPLGLATDDEPASPDAFESMSADDEPAETRRVSVELEGIPIEIISMIDNFLDGLTAKVNPTPPNIDSLSRRFQAFYTQASDRLKTHVQGLATFKPRRPASPATSTSSRISSNSLFRTRSASRISTASTEPDQQQMLTGAEILDRKRERKLLQAKKKLLEEAIERRLCEGIYDKIYRHYSTQDEALDAKLRSKTAALDVVRIGLPELGVHLGNSTSDNTAEKLQEVRDRLETARQEIMYMYRKRYPLAKLHHLKAAHKEIVDTLAHYHPSSSADEIMPMLIYTLITLSPANLNVVSDLKFIQRFRWEPKLVGEAAYCLTNLEAAISFLDTVDLSTLRDDESVSGPPKDASTVNKAAMTPTLPTFPPAYTAPSPYSQVIHSKPEVTRETVAGLKTSTSPTSPSRLRAAATEAHNRRLSDLVQTPAQAIGAASDTIFTTADHGIKTISASLGDSYRFFIGRLRNTGVEGVAPAVSMPQTLEDARKLIETPAATGADEDEDEEPDESAVAIEVEEGQSEHGSDKDKPRMSVEDRVLSIVGGRKTSVAARKLSSSKPRDRSVESTKSTGSSSKRVVFASSPCSAPVAGNTTDAKVASGTDKDVANAGLTGSMLSLGSSLNPVTRFGVGMNMIRGLGRSAPLPAAATAEASKPLVAAKDGVGNGDFAITASDTADSSSAKELPKISPPIQHFLEIEDPGELKLREALELLRDYRRLAAALRERDAFLN